MSKPRICYGRLKTDNLNKKEFIMKMYGFVGYYPRKGVKIEHYNPKMINDLARNYPYQTIIF